MSCLGSGGYRLLSFTEPAARDHRDGSLCHYDDEPHFQTLVTATNVSTVPIPFLSLALALPVVKSASSDIQTTLRASMAKQPQIPNPTEAGEEREAIRDAEECSLPTLPLSTFHAFGNLPPELRIKIWRLTFLPRVVELHPTWSNHAADVHENGRQEQQWQSGCSNSAALSVCLEAREIALEHFRIAFPLTSVTTQKEAPLSGTISNGRTGLRRRTLYISPEHDVVALLGQDTGSTGLSNLLDSCRDADLKRVGIGSLALSTSGKGNDESATTNFDPTILKDLDQLILFTYDELVPPSEWNARGTGLDEKSLACFRNMGNKCELVPCKSSNAWYVYKEWRREKGRQFWDNQSRTLHVGKNSIRIQDLEFAKGW